MAAASSSSAAATSLAAHRSSHLMKLTAEYTAAGEELARLNDSLVKDLSGYEAAKGRPFLYKGQRLLNLLQVSSGGAPFSSMGLTKAGAPDTSVRRETGLMW